MKILIVFNHPAPYKILLFNELGKYFDLTVIFERRRASDRLDSFYSFTKYNFKTIFCRGGSFGKENCYSKDVARYIKKEYQTFDHIIMNGYSTISEMIAIKFMNRKKIPFILMINGGIIHNNEGRIKKWLKTKYISSANEYLSPSEFSNKYLVYYGANKEKIHLYPYSSIRNDDILTTPISTIDKLSIRKTYNLPAGLIFIAPNQFIERKNNINLIKYFENRNEYLLLVGHGPEKEKYVDYIQNKNIKNIIILDEKNRNDLFELYKACDAVISFSNEDIFGHTILEGMANGIPAIASNKIVSANSSIKNGLNGFVINTNQQFEIDNAINNIHKCKFTSCIECAKNNSIEVSAKAIKDILIK